MSHINPRTYKVVFGHVLAALRKHKEITQVDFSEKTEISQPTLSRIERGLVLPDVYTCKSIVATLGLTMGEFNMAIDGIVERTITTASGVLGCSAEEANSKLEAMDEMPVKGLVTFAVATFIHSKTV